MNIARFYKKIKIFVRFSSKICNPSKEICQSARIASVTSTGVFALALCFSRAPLHTENDMISPQAARERIAVHRFFAFCSASTISSASAFLSAQVFALSFSQSISRFPQTFRLSCYGLYPFYRICCSYIPRSILLRGTANTF